MKEILENIKNLAKENNWELSGNEEKIAKVKERFFGTESWVGCPCDGENTERYCGSDLCNSDIETNGICHCRLYKRIG